MTDHTLLRSITGIDGTPAPGAAARSRRAFAAGTAAAALSRVSLNRRVLHPAVLFATASLLGLACAPAARAQDSEIWQTVFRGATEVNVVNVDVFVTDADGEPVAGLTRDDFELLENGEPVEISNFYAVENGTALELAEEEPAPDPGVVPRRGVLPREDRQLYLIIYVDNANIAESNRGRVFARLREFLLAHQRPDTRVMLVSNDSAVVIRQSFTAVTHDVFLGLAGLEGTTSANLRFDVDRQNLLREMERVNVEGTLDGTKVSTEETLVELINAEAAAVLPQIRIYCDQYLRHVKETVRVLSEFVDMAGGLPGHKSVLYVSDGLALRPGEGLFEAYARRVAVLEDPSVRISPEVETSRFDASTDYFALLDQANASGVTFYSLDASPPSVLGRGSAESTGSGGSELGAFRDGFESTEGSNRQNTLTLMAEGTGGRFGLTPNAFEPVITSVFTDFDNYYSIGYVAERRDGDGKRKVEVRLRERGNGWRVRHRDSLRDKTAVERAAERAQAALLIDDPAQLGFDNALEIGVETRPEQAQEDGNFVVPLLVKVPLGKLVLLPGESEHQAQVSMFVAVRDDQGRTSRISRQLCPIRIPNAEVLTALGQKAGCGVRLLMRKGPQKVAVSVLDEAAATYSTVSLALDVGAAPASASSPPLGSSSSTGSANPSNPPASEEVQR